MDEYTSSDDILRVEDMVDISNEYKKEVKYIKKLLKMYTNMTGIKVPQHKIEIVNLEDKASAMVIANSYSGINDIAIAYDSSRLKEGIQADTLCMTVWHEVAHLIDIVNYNKIKDDQGRGYEFTVWTEYNARYTSMKLYMQYKNETKEMFMGWLKHSQLDAINNILENRLSKLNSTYENGSIDKMRKKFSIIYELTQYFGAYSLFEELDYEYFKDAEQFIDLSDYNLGLSQVKELYGKLQSLRSIKDVFCNNDYRGLRSAILQLFMLV